MQTCSKCHAYFNKYSVTNLGQWTCEFCLQLNPIGILKVESEICETEIEKNDKIKVKLEHVVLCIDNSGSMSTSTILKSISDLSGQQNDEEWENLK